MWLQLSVLTLCAVYSAFAQSSQTLQIEPFESVFSKAEGSTLKVNCTSPNSVRWSAIPKDAMPQNAVEARASSRDNISTLKLVGITKKNEGEFRCTDSTTGVEVSFQLKVFHVATRSATFEYKVDTMLECSVTGRPDLSFKYSWKKGDTPVSNLDTEEKQGFVSHENGSLGILAPARRFAGMYTCTAEYEENAAKHNVTVDVPYYATPKVLPFDKSKNLVQEEKLVVECQVLGYPKPYITWMKGGKVIKVGKDSQYKLLPAKTYDTKEIDDGRLEIESVGFNDAGEYVCMARHRMWPNANSSEPILVRVKDKLAALWPFLGIVAEVVILCTVIFICEKKRNKDAMMEEEDDQDRRTSEKPSDNVRHRPNTNNPRA